MYNHKNIESKWQAFWDEHKTYKTKEDLTLPKFFTLIEFPYPSGAGLHVGHVKGQTAVDIFARFKRMNGYNVLNAIGWDAFGLPAENFAIKNKKHPAIFTQENIDNFRKQIKSFGPSFDWDKEIDTTDSSYYKWTQWIFLQLFKKGLAYEKKAPINWCPSCKTGLANEEVVDGKCERCDSDVEQKLMKQWFLRITAYADRLISDLDGLNWPEYIKTSQKNWIGKSEGTEFSMVAFDDTKEYGLYSVWDENIDENLIKSLVTDETVIYAEHREKVWKFIFKFDSKNLYKDYMEKYLITFGLVSGDDKLYQVYDYVRGNNSLQGRLISVIKNNVSRISVFTTRIDTVFGMSYSVIAPDHPDVMKFISDEQKFDCEKYIEVAKNKTAMERTELNKDKTGVFTGSYVINPFNGESLPLWIADYVLGNYGTGAVMAVPAHDERDYVFAKKYNLPIKTSVEPVTGNPKDNEQFRRSIVALVYDPKQDKYLSLNWGELGGNLFVGGGVEDGEDLVECAKREIIEETGYKNFKFVGMSENIHHHYFAHSKSIDRYILATGLYFELTGDETCSQDLTEFEKDKFKLEWLTKSECEKRVVDGLHKYVFDKFVNDKINTEYGILVNSGEFTGSTSENAISKLQNWLKEKGIGRIVSNYKLRDWLFSRQRYRGEPIPVIHLDIENLKQLPHIYDLAQAKDQNLAYIMKRQPLDGEEVCDIATCGGMVRELVINGRVFSKIYDGIDSKIICDERLPLELPEVEEYEPAGDGQSPLAKIDSFVNVKLADNLVGKRETNTMPQWAGSSWYFLRYIDSTNKDQIGSPEKLKYFMPVDIYFGGAEHTTVHLLYSRFWNKALYDMGIVPTSEPYKRRVQHGLIQGEDGRKMSKRWGNVINPDDVIATYGADTMRTYIMFMGPYQDGASWSTAAINGVNRFIKKVYDLKDKIIDTDREETIRLLHKTIKKVTEDIESVSYHTAMSQMMIMLNHINDIGGISKDSLKIYLQLLAPFAPFVTEELWEILGERGSIHLTSWPKFNIELTIDNVVSLAIQFSGKMRGTIEVSKDISQDDILNLLKSDEKFSKYFAGDIKKVIFVPGKIINVII